MAFRANESVTSGFESLKSYFISRNFNTEERERSEQVLIELVEKYGPVIEGYPSWHPLVTHHDDRFPQMQLSNQCGYEGLDHTRYFVNAFVTCPYDNGQKVLDSVAKLPHSSMATIYAERLDVKLYNSNATPILVYCEWDKPLSPNNRMIPAAIAIPLMLQKEIPCCEWSSVAESWETMRHYFFGSPHGARSSLFIDQETASTMKKIWNLLINTGMFGPIK